MRNTDAHDAYTSPTKTFIRQVWNRKNKNDNGCNDHSDIQQKFHIVSHHRCIPSTYIR